MRCQLTQSQQGSPVPTLAAMLWKMFLMCGLKNTHTRSAEYNSPRDSSGCPWQLGFQLWQFMKHHKVWEISPGLLVSPWHERGSVARPFLPTTDSATDEQQPFLFQTLTTPLNDSKHRSCVRTLSVVKTHCWRAFLSPTVVSLYSELPPSMMISPASSRGTWGVRHGPDQVRQGSTQRISAV